jgi:hypothetical protein
MGIQVDHERAGMRFATRWGFRQEPLHADFVVDMRWQRLHRDLSRARATPITSPDLLVNIEFRHRILLGQMMAEQ